MSLVDYVFNKRSEKTEKIIGFLSFTIYPRRCAQAWLGGSLTLDFVVLIFFLIEEFKLFYALSMYVVVVCIYLY